MKSKRINDLILVFVGCVVCSVAITAYDTVSAHKSTATEQSPVIAQRALVIKQEDQNDGKYNHRVDSLYAMKPDEVTVKRKR